MHLEESNIIEIPTQATEQATEAVQLAKVYDGFKVSNANEYEATAFDLKRIKAKRAELDDTRKKLTIPLDETKKRIMEFFRKPIEFLDMAEAAVKRAILAYQTEQQRIAAEAQRKANEAARAEEERKRKALETKAVKAEEKGNDVKAELLREQAESVFVPAPVITANVPKVSGLSMRESWKYDLIDINLVPREYLLLDEKKVGGMVRLMKGQTNIPGIKVYKEDVIA